MDPRFLWSQWAMDDGIPDNIKKNILNSAIISDKEIKQIKNNLLYSRN